jgi:hypothetical protein
MSHGSVQLGSCDASSSPLGQGSSTLSPDGLAAATCRLACRESHPRVTLLGRMVPFRAIAPRSGVGGRGISNRGLPPGCPWADSMLVGRSEPRAAPTSMNLCTVSSPSGSAPRRGRRESRSAHSFIPFTLLGGEGTREDGCVVGPDEENSRRFRKFLAKCTAGPKWNDGQAPVLPRGRRGGPLVGPAARIRLA